MPIAEGNFEVRLTPQGGHDAVPADLGRLGIDKNFRGDLVGASQGEMLAVNSADGFAVYVALERVEGTLEGRAGSFWLTHRGTIHGEDSHLDVTVVPGSGTGDFAGLAGSMTIDPANDHAYAFDYLLPD